MLIELLQRRFLALRILCRYVLSHCRQIKLLDQCDRRGVYFLGCGGVSRILVPKGFGNSVIEVELSAHK